MLPEIKEDFVSVISGGAINHLCSPAEEIALAEKGVSPKALQNFEKAMDWDAFTAKTVFRVTRRTLERHVREKKRLNLEVSENALDVAQLTSMGISYFGNLERWKQWLNTPHIQFGNKPPLSALNTLRGRDLIRRIIRGLEYGFVA